jgi:hypothetical protein
MPSFAVGGFGKDADAGAVEELKKEFKDIMSKFGPKGVYFVNDVDKSNVKEAERIGREGRNEYKAASAHLTSTFVVYAPDRMVGEELVRSLWECFRVKAKLPSALDLRKAASQRRLEREQSRAKRHIRILRWLETKPDLLKLLPKGSMDGFRQAEERGITEELATPPAATSWSRNDKKIKRSHRLAVLDLQTRKTDASDRV